MLTKNLSVSPFPEGVSVIVCCYNSKNLISQTIRHIALQKVSYQISWEVIIIDNGSTDNTAEVANAEWKKYGVESIEFRIVVEKQQGLIHARNRAIIEAKYEYLLFCDDDNWLEENYVSIVYSIMSGDSNIGVLGGNGSIVPEEPIQLEQILIEQTTVHGSQTWATNDHWVYGAGSTYRKSVFSYLADKGWKPITTGRSGTKLVSGDDTEICFMFYLLGYSIIANNNLKFSHFVELKKQTESYLNRLYFWVSYSYYLLFSYIIIIDESPLPINVFTNKLLISTCKRAIGQLIGWTPRQSTKLDRRKDLLTNLGMIYSILQNYKLVKFHHQKIVKIIKELH